MRLAYGKVLGGFALVSLIGSTPVAAQTAVGTPSQLRLGIRFDRAVFQPAVALSERPATPRIARGQTNRPVHIRVHGGFITGQSAIAFSGFVIGAGIGIPIAGREDMEFQIDLSYAKYSGGPEEDGFTTTTIDGKAVAPTVLFIYNFVRDGRKVTPYVGGGTILARIDETQTDDTTFPGAHFIDVFHTRGWLNGPQGVAGVQIPMNDRSKLRLEGRLGFTLDGGLFIFLAGVSF